MAAIPSSPLKAMGARWESGVPHSGGTPTDGAGISASLQALGGVFRRVGAREEALKRDLEASKAENATLRARVALLSKSDASGTAAVATREFPSRPRPIGDDRDSATPREARVTPRSPYSPPPRRGGSLHLADFGTPRIPQGTPGASPRSSVGIDPDTLERFGPDTSGRDNCFTGLLTGKSTALLEAFFRRNFSGAALADYLRLLENFMTEYHSLNMAGEGDPSAAQRSQKRLLETLSNPIARPSPLSYHATPRPRASDLAPAPREASSEYLWSDWTFDQIRAILQHVIRNLGTDQIDIPFCMTAQGYKPETVRANRQSQLDFLQSVVRDRTDHMNANHLMGTLDRFQLEHTKLMRDYRAAEAQGSREKHNLKEAVLKTQELCCTLENIAWKTYWTKHHQY